MTKADLEQDIEDLRNTIIKLETARKDGQGNYLALQAKIKTLKFVARHYKKQRDQVDAYLSAVLDLTLETPEPTKDALMPLPGGAGGDRMMRHDPPLPLTTRPCVDSPRGVEDDRYPSLSDGKRIAWEDF